MRNHIVTVIFSSKISIALVATLGAAPAPAMPLNGTERLAGYWTPPADFEIARVVPASEHSNVFFNDHGDTGVAPNGDGEGGDGDGDGKDTGTPKSFFPQDNDDESAAEKRVEETRSPTDSALEDLFEIDEPTQSISGPGAARDAQILEETSERIRAAQFLCGGIPTVYRIDCLADQFATIAKDLPDVGELGELKAALNTASQDLAKIARQNRDPRAARVRPVSNTIPGQPEASRALRAVRPELQEAAEQQALAVVDQLATVLLRSADNATRNSIYFARLAQAVDSNKILLRSA